MIKIDTITIQDILGKMSRSWMGIIMLSTDVKADNIDTGKMKDSFEQKCSNYLHTSNELLSNHINEIDLTTCTNLKSIFEDKYILYIYKISKQEELFLAYNKDEDAVFALSINDPMFAKYGFEMYVLEKRD